MVPVWMSPSPAMSRRKDNNEPRPKYFNSGVELIFRKSWNFFASVTSFQMHEIGGRSSSTRPRVDTERTQTRHGSAMRPVTKLFCATAPYGCEFPALWPCVRIWGAVRFASGVSTRMADLCDYAPRPLAFVF